MKGHSAKVVLLLALLSANLGIFFHSILTIALTLGFFLIIPGYLIVQKLNLTSTSTWERFALSLAVSTFMLIISGLLANIFQVFGIMQPLSISRIFMINDFMVVCLIATFKASLPRLRGALLLRSKLQYIGVGILTFLPIMAAAGANRLNNGAGNAVTMILFITVAFVFVTLVMIKKLEPLYGYATIMFGLSLLLTVSLRGSFITGHDIQHEFYVFQITSSNSIWSMNFLRDAYNACLSITILPTVIQRLTGCDEAIVFKVIMQLIYSLSLPAVYSLVKRVANARLALVAVFVFISFPTFLNDLPMLIRQEIGFVFFSTILMTAFIPAVRSVKTKLTLLFLVGLVLSHYSSSYVTLGILFVAWLAYKVISIKVQSNSAQDLYLPILNIRILLVALLVTFLWNNQVTSTGGGLQNTIENSVRQLIDKSATRSQDVNYSLLGSSAATPQSQLISYAGKNIDQVSYESMPSLSITRFGQVINKLYSVAAFNTFARSTIAKLFQVLPLLGIVVLLFEFRKIQSVQRAYVIAISISCMALLVLQTLLPQLSLDYGTLRFFQQALVVLSIPIVIGAAKIFARLGKEHLTLLAIFFGVIFMHLSGFLPQLTGGYPAQLSLNNSGEYFRLYYLHRGELDAATWLVQNGDRNKAVQTDGYALLRFPEQYRHTGIRFSDLVDAKDGTYVYKDSSNVTNGVYTLKAGGSQVSYKLNYSLDNKKNNIYTTVGGEVYR